MKKWKRIILACCIPVGMAEWIIGCGTEKIEMINESYITENHPDDGELSFPMEEYNEKIKENRSEISSYQQYYADDIKNIKEGHYKNLNFDNCTFMDFPHIDQLELMKGQSHGITVQESWETIENWLKEIGKSDEVDMKKEVRVVSPQLGTDDNDDYYLFYDHMSELETGEGAFITNNKCHIQIADDGIYSMSDGKITEYLELKSKASEDALGGNSENIETFAHTPELIEASYELMTGDMPISEGVNLVKTFFQEGTPFPCASGVTVDVPEVRVFHLGDIYGYDYTVRRCYKNVPFAYTDYGSFHSDANYCISGDIKHAYVVDNTGVAAFAGYNESEYLFPLFQDDKFIGIRDSVQYLEENLAPYLNIQVDDVELVYAPITFPNSNNPEERIIVPCWEFIGINHTKEEKIWLYVDVFTGDIYYYTRDLEE